jgi:hypothetical protein
MCQSGTSCTHLGYPAINLSTLWFLLSLQAWSNVMLFSKATDFLIGRDHKFVRDYLFISLALVATATVAGLYLSRTVVMVDDMPVASIQKRVETDRRVYNVVRSVLNNGHSSRVLADQSIGSNARLTSSGDVTGSVGDAMRKVTIDPCTGETKN